MIDKKQVHTKNAFSFKWKQRDIYESDRKKQKYYNWPVSRYFGSENERIKFLEQNKGKSLLDAGCGRGGYHCYCKKIIIKED